MATTTPAPANELEAKATQDQDPRRPGHRCRRNTRAGRITSSRIRSACATIGSRTTNTSCSSSWTASTRSTTPRRAYEKRFRPERLKLEDLEGVRPATAHRRAGPERIAAGRQAALRPPQETQPQRMDADAHQHPLHQDPGLRSRSAADAACSATCGWIFSLWFFALSVAC